MAVGPGRCPQPYFSAQPERAGPMDCLGVALLQPGGEGVLSYESHG